MGTEWQVDEFGAHHEGRAVALLADGTEPRPAIFDTGSGSSVHQTREWWAYTGTLTNPRATDLRGGCSCGWRGDTVYPLDWEALGDYPYDVDTPGPYEDWAEHIRQVEARTVPVPYELTELLQRLDERLSDLADDAPVAALRIVAALERAAKRTGLVAAFNIGTDDDVPWETVGEQLGMSESDARMKVFGYQHSE